MSLFMSLGEIEGHMTLFMSLWTDEGRHVMPPHPPFSEVSVSGESLQKTPPFS